MGRKFHLVVRGVRKICSFSTFRQFLTFEWLPRYKLYSRHERMLSKDSKNGESEGLKDSEDISTSDAKIEKEEGKVEESSSRQRRGLGSRKDSVHPTFLMVNKCDHNELRRKFRNYEI